MNQENTRADGAPVAPGAAGDEKDTEASVDDDQANTEGEQRSGGAAEIDGSDNDDNNDSSADAQTGDLAQAQALAEKNWSLYLGARAEADNIKKRAERDVQNAHKYALDRFVSELLPVKDSLELGLSAATETTDMDKLIEGSELTLKMLSTALEKFAVEEVDPLGSQFNPELHEAMAMQPSADAEPNTVLQVIQKGYLLHGRLVRPALVIVARAA